MSRPIGTGLVEIAGGNQKERGFTCMKLIEFLTDDDVTDWERWHGAHLQASTGECPYRTQCPIHARTLEKHPGLKQRVKQLSLFPEL